MNNNLNKICTAGNAPMQVQQRTGADGKVYIKLPELGIETYALNKGDVPTAIDEAIECFFIAAHTYGRGIAAELDTVGLRLC